jgi:hypothetical protein
MRLIGYIACMGYMINDYNIFIESLKEREHSRELSVDGRVILKLFLKQGDRMWTGFSCLRIATGGELL